MSLDLRKYDKVHSMKTVIIIWALVLIAATALYMHINGYINTRVAEAQAVSTQPTEPILINIKSHNPQLTVDGRLLQGGR